MIRKGEEYALPFSYKTHPTFPNIALEANLPISQLLRQHYVTPPFVSHESFASYKGFGSKNSQVFVISKLEFCPLFAFLYWARPSYKI